jgi:hypothetical protein
MERNTKSYEVKQDGKTIWSFRSPHNEGAIFGLIGYAKFKKVKLHDLILIKEGTETINPADYDMVYYEKHRKPKSKLVEKIS